MSEFESHWQKAIMTKNSKISEIVQNLEEGELSLEDSMTLFERGLNLSQASQEKLKNAEQKIQILLTKNGKTQLETFENEGESDNTSNN